MNKKIIRYLLMTSGSNFKDKITVGGLIVGIIVLPFCIIFAIIKYIWEIKLWEAK